MNILTESRRPRRRTRARLAWTIGLLLLTQLGTGAAADTAPQRIISLAPSMTETVYALGRGDRLVGVSIYCDYPPGVEKIDRVGTFLTPNLEVILAKHPDIVLAVPSPGNREPVEQLRRLGVQVLVLEPQTVEQIKDAQLAVGRALGAEVAAQRLVQEIDERMAAIQARVAGAPIRHTLMVVGQTPLIAVGHGTFLDELITMARGKNLGAQAGAGWPHVSIELPIATAPEVIIDTTMGNEEQPGAAASMAFWKDLTTIPAVRDGKVHGYKQYQLLRPGPRIDEALDTIARIIHPERFP